MISLVIDAGLLILFVVGTTSPEYIGKHKRLRAFSNDDYDLLIKIMGRASKIILTPNTVTEASNLLKRIEKPARQEVYTAFKAIIENFGEQYVESQKGSKQPEFIRLGMTDAILLTFS